MGLIYYPFGMLQPGRKYSAANGYRYGFNSQERDSEVYGTGNLSTAKYWEYDSRIGRRWNLDPKGTSETSKYSTFFNNPIMHIDIHGDTPVHNIGLGIVDYKPWKTLLFTTAPELLFKQANKRFWVHEFIDQKMSMAFGEDLNLDYYPVQITKLPPAFKTAGELFTYLRKDLSKLLVGGGNELEAYNTTEKKIWESNNPSSAIMRFKGYVNGRNIDDADVITTNYTYTDKAASWTFRPVNDISILNPIYGGDKGHPLAGNREFGIAPNGKGGYLFYTQGVDRMWSMGDVVVGGVILDNQIFRSADVLWRAVMNNAVTEINKLGGSATFDVNSVVSKRINYCRMLTSEDQAEIRKVGN